MPFNDFKTMQPLRAGLLESQQIPLLHDSRRACVSAAAQPGTEETAPIMVLPTLITVWRLR